MKTYTLNEMSPTPIGYFAIGQGDLDQNFKVGRRAGVLTATLALIALYKLRSALWGLVFNAIEAYNRRRYIKALIKDVDDPVKKAELEKEVKKADTSVLKQKAKIKKLNQELEGEYRYMKKLKIADKLQKAELRLGEAFDSSDLARSFGMGVGKGFQDVHKFNKKYGFMIVVFYMIAKIAVGIVKRKKRIEFLLQSEKDPEKRQELEQSLKEMDNSILMIRSDLKKKRDELKKMESEGKIDSDSYRKTRRKIKDLEADLGMRIAV